MNSTNRPQKNGPTIALLVAAGKSERMQAELPKPYLQLGKNSLMRQTVKAFLNHPGIDGVRVVIRREHHMLYKQAIAGLVLFPCVIGGDSRQESTRLGLESIAHHNPEYVLVHDIARPLATAALISRVLDALKLHGAVVPALKITDTVKRAQNGLIGETIDREHLYTVQTPQGFHFQTLRNAHETYRGAILSDDSAVIERAGGKVAMVEGETENIKITTMQDIRHMQIILSQQFETRVGSGYDVHTLKEHDHDTPQSQKYIKLCGIRVPFTHTLVGHSDADVGLHALVDALLGAISGGDIGMHFPPSDPKWKGADSEQFLLHTYEMLTSRGGELVHFDITLICEQPKISPYREQMIQHLAQLLKLLPDRISIKATTTEKLGFTGRGEGIAAQAVATVRLPL